MIDGTPLSAPPSPAPKTLPGRNCILGPLAEAVFTCVTSISDHRALACTEKGQICLIESSEGQRLVKVGNESFGITCISVDPGGRFVWVGGRDGNVSTLLLSDLITPSTPPAESPLALSRSASPKNAGCGPSP